MFVSYRRNETEHVAGRLADHLRKQFGKSRVFMDVDSIRAGTDFVAAIKRHVGSSSVVLVLIGPRWTTMSDRVGARRLDDPDDYVVLEIKEAFEKNIPVVPLLVDGAQMPTAEDLPDDLHSLVHQNGLRIDGETFASDTSHLVTELRDYVPRFYTPTLSRRNVLLLVGSAALSGGALGIGYVLTRPTKPVWVAKAGDQIYSSPTVAESTLYIGSEDHYLYAFDAESGRRLWRYLTGGAVNSTPAVAEGTVYVGSDDHHIHAIDAESGHRLWAFKTGGKIHSSPAVAGGVVYVGSRDNKLYAIDARTGGKNWYFPGEPQPDEAVRGFNSSPTVVDGVVYIGCRDHNVYAVRDGKELWRRTTKSTVDSSAMVSREKVWIGSDDDNLYALKVATGDVAGNLFQTSDDVVSTPAVSDDKNVVFVGSSDGNLYAVEADTHQSMWEFRTGGSIRSSPEVHDGTVYVGSADRSLYAMDAVTGEKRWSYDTGAGINDSSPTVVGGIVYCANLAGRVYALDAHQGADV